MAKLKEQIKTPEKELSDKEIDNLCDTEVVQYTGHQDAHRSNWAWSQNEEISATQSKIKQNIQGTDSEGKETRTEINDLEQKEEISIQLE